MKKPQLFNLWRLIRVLTLLVCSSLANAHDFVAERAWVEDPSGTMTLAEVAKEPETRFENKHFSRGFSQSTFWLRLHIVPDGSSNLSPQDKLVLRIRPAYQDQIQLFDPLADQNKVRVTGDYFDWAKDEYQSLNLNFVIPIGKMPRDVWLRLRTNQSTFTVVEVMSENEARTADRKQEIGAMIYFAVLFTCMGWAVLSFINQRDYLVGIFVVREIVVICYALVILGYLRVFSSGWLPAAWIDPIFNNIVFLFVAYALWFDTQLISLFKPNPWSVRLTYGLIALMPGAWLLQVFGKAHLAIILNNIFLLIAIVLVFFMVVTTRAWKEAKNVPAEQQPEFSKGFLIGLYVLIFGVTLLNRLPTFGFVFPDWFAHEMGLYYNLIYALVSSVAMMVLVQIRSHRRQKQLQAAQQRADFAQEEIAKERARRVEQTNFLKMLAHEMKTPLSVVRMAMGATPLPGKSNEIVDRAVTDMNNIVDRLLHVERLQDQQIVIRNEKFDIWDLTQGLALSLSEGQRIRLHGQAISLESDLQLVRTIISNLLDNALKYSPTDSPVDVSLTVIPGSLQIVVENDVGLAGVPDPEKVFDKYYRADRAQARTGSGLGLYLVRSIATLLGGHVRYKQAEGRIRFEVELPINV